MPQRIHIQIHKSKQQSNIEVSKASITPPTILNHNLGLKNYELSNHLGNVTTVISDRKIPRAPLGSNTTIAYYMPDIVSATDYYPFGMTMQERTFSAGGEAYRFGFNGQEKDNEISVDGGNLDFGARIYDSRLGRWMGVDILANKYASFSPYNYCTNSPLVFIDPDGKVVVPAPGVSTEIWNQFVANADPKTKAMIATLDASKVTYRIFFNTVASPQDPSCGGQTEWTTPTQPDPNQQEIRITINAPTGQQQDAWTYNALGDEVCTAFQVEKGDIGFARVQWDDGRVTTIPTGYDFMDECETKAAAVQNAQNNGVDLTSSSESYNKKVQVGGMTPEKWIRKFKAESGDSYKNNFIQLGGIGLNTVLPAYLLGNGDGFNIGTRVENPIQKIEGTVTGFIYMHPKQSGANQMPLHLVPSLQ